MDRGFNALLARLRSGACGIVLRHRLAMLVVFVGGAGGDGPHVRHHPDRLHPGSGQRLAVRQHARGPGHVVLRHGEVGAAGRRHHHQEPQCRFVHRHGRRRRRIGQQRAPAACSSSRAPSAPRPRSRSPSRSAPQILRFPGVPRLHRPAAVAADRRAHGQSELQPDDAGARTPRSSTPWAPTLEQAVTASCPRSRTSRPTSR